MGSLLCKASDCRHDDSGLKVLAPRSPRLECARDVASTAALSAHQHGNLSAKLVQMQVQGLQPPHANLHRLIHSLWPEQVKVNLWRKHLEETYADVRIGRIFGWNLHPKNWTRQRF